MAKAEASVEELVGMIERGELRLPEMQRRFVWRSTRVRDLLDSLYRGYPSGGILLWETDEAVPLQPFAVTQQANPYQSTRLLLDGQQRLTSLAAVIRGQAVSVRGRQRPIELLFNLEHPEQLAVVTEVEEDGDDDDLIEDEADSTDDELQRRFDKMTFVVSTRKLEQLPQWVRVSEVFETDSDVAFLKRAGISEVDDPRCEKYSQRLARLRGVRKYVYRMDVLERRLTYNEVTEIFVRVNSHGAKLRSSDLALAQITVKWRNSLKIFQEFQQQSAKIGFDLDLGLYLRNLIVFATGQSRFLTVRNLSEERLRSAWKEGCEGMMFALNFVKNNIGIDSPALLSSPFLLVTLGFLGHKRDYQISSSESRQLRYWVLVANAKGRYSRGSSETILDQDLATLRQGSAAELIDRLRLQMGRLDVAPDELEGRNQRSSLFKTMFLAFRDAGAKDWRSNLAIALDHSGAQHKLQFHHIFPKAVLTKHGHTSREADDIANLSFIGGKTNRAISDKAPSDYLPPLIAKTGPAAFEAQCIPTVETLLQVQNYEGFLSKRREAIASRLNAFLGTPS
ncbi:MAG: GmrSD restriction endonuclease domain-containing protein [Alphaproteobacteria bacterium]